MLTLLFKTFRFLIVVSAVLLIGQIPVEGRTVGEHFSIWVKAGFKSTQEKISKSKLVASLPRYLPGDQKIGDPEQNDSEKKKNETISSSDRESLLRVLQ